MVAGSGSVAITACRSGARTIIERVRYDGISRCSRAFAYDDAALIVLSQLGPGVVRGDDVTLSGRLRPNSRLIVTNQTATRLMGGTLPAQSNVSWILESGAELDLVGEPVIAYPNASYVAATTIDLGEHANVLVTEIACVPTGAHVRLRTSVRSAQHELFYDSVDAAAAAPATVGTLALVGVDAAAIPVLIDALDAVADAAVGVAIGIGALTTGVFARVVSDDVWAVRAALIGLRAAARLSPPSTRSA